MGSGISAPNPPDNAEMETHEDIMEVRLDHMAFGGTAMIIILICAVLYCTCRRKRRSRNQQIQQIQQTRTWYPGPIIMPPPSTYAPWMHPMTNFQHPMHSYGQMELLFDPHQQAAMYRPQRPPPYDGGRNADHQDTGRFTELPVTNNTTATPTSSQGERLEMPRLPSPHRTRMINPARSIQETTN